MYVMTQMMCPLHSGFLDFGLGCWNPHNGILDSSPHGWHHDNMCSDAGGSSMRVHASVPACQHLIELACNLRVLGISLTLTPVVPSSLCGSHRDFAKWTWACVSFWVLWGPKHPSNQTGVSCTCWCLCKGSWARHFCLEYHILAHAARWSVWCAWCSSFWGALYTI